MKRKNLQSIKAMTGIMREDIQSVVSNTAAEAEDAYQALEYINGYLNGFNTGFERAAALMSEDEE